MILKRVEQEIEGLKSFVFANKIVGIFCILYAYRNKIITMQSTQVTVLNPAGLHARPSAMLVKLCTKFKSKVFLDQDGYKINAKSILGVMTLAAEQDSELTLITDGEDEVQALNEIKKLFELGFHEMDGAED